MAMGSGAFLVQTARYLSERLMEAWEVAEAQHRSKGETGPQITPEGALSRGAPDETLVPQEANERQALALRLICDRCLYGVDKNPMAVEMAKLSLWLVTLDRERPFTFLDHALRCGDSLLGIAEIGQLARWSLDREDAESPGQLVWFEPVIRRALAVALKRRREIEARPAEGIGDLEEKERLLAEAEDAMALVQLGADLLVGSALAPEAKERERLRQDLLAWYFNAVTAQEEYEQARVAFTAEHRAKAQEDVANLRARAEALLGRRKPFHWPLEFPEVFVAVEREGQEPGFAGIVGNPPFMGGHLITGALGTEYRDHLVEDVAYGQRGRSDLCAYFFLRAARLLRLSGAAGLLATNTIAQGDTREVGLDQLVHDGLTPFRAISSLRWPGSAALEVSLVWLHKGQWGGTALLDDTDVGEITAQLLPAAGLQGNPHRLVANSGKSYKGSFVFGMGFVLDP